MSSLLIKPVDFVRTVTPDEIAMLFADLDGDEQAKVFNKLAKIALTWPGGCWAFQLQAISDSKELTLEGRSLMIDIGDYGREACPTK